MANGEHQIWETIVDWGRDIGAALGLIATAVVGWMFRRYLKDRERLMAVETKTEEIDLRLGTIAEALETVIEHQDGMRDKQEDMRNDVTEIRTDVKWIRRTMNGEMKNE